MKNQLPIIHGLMLISIFSSHDMALMAQNVPSLKLENLRVENQANPAGIDTDESGPGYKQIKIMPHIGGNLTFARADLQTYYGRVSSHWKSENGKLQLAVEILANTSATVYLPAPTVASVKESSRALSSAKDLKAKGKVGDYVVVEVGSGSYDFTWEKSAK